MSTLIEQIEAMSIRMNELATEEHELVRTLGEELAGVDQRLLEEVRNVAAAHDARRGAILRELQMLAGRMCSLHGPREPAAALEHARQEEPVGETQAAANIQEELAYHLKLRTGSVDPIGGRRQQTPSLSLARITLGHVMDMSGSCCGSQLNPTADGW
jgi:hypothetical protein